MRTRRLQGVACEHFGPVDVRPLRVEEDSEFHLDGLSGGLPALGTTGTGAHERNGLLERARLVTGRLTLLGATSAGEAWTVALAEGGGSALVRSDGREWRSVPGSYQASDITPKLTVGSFTTGPDDVWLGGDTGVYQWDGRRWTFHALPDLRPEPAVGFEFAAVTLAGTGPDDVWAVSRAVYHWDRQAWTNLAPLPGEVHGLWSPRRGLVFAIGYRVTPPADKPDATFGVMLE